MARSEADAYRTYLRSSEGEFEGLICIIEEATFGMRERNRKKRPDRHGEDGLSILDVGAGNGAFLAALWPKGIFSRYVAFEKDGELCEELKAVALEIVPKGAAVINNAMFSGGSALGKSAGKVDVVLMSHALYGYEQAKK